MSEELNVAALLDFAVEIAESSGAIALRYFRASVEVQNKLHDRGFDPVTIADREVESYLRERISAEYPEHGIIGEEHGTQHGSSSLRWIIDPIDGTRSFISGATNWGTLIGVIDGDQCILGIMHAPFTHEIFVGTRSEAWTKHHGEHRPLQVRDTASLADAVLYCTHPDTFVTQSERDGFQRVSAAARMTRYGGDCYSYAMLALGQVDLIIEGCLQPYDIIPLIPIIESAGGVVTDVHGNSAMQGGVIVTAANPAVHRQALELMASARRD